ncbi:RNA methyltransferase [Fructilactobacillus myrtifloralis]|uniref:RNA methyltransferase n=1 Tax=Fructilactobacillus myrtifloralis TaxID=2940301 RepID=A0ABY5BNL0_9LACO|nr:RNA methyltransferase [Fructilactobacillus myrtifloralis]USS85260.1 RNA methyltransferase [Fructilactobacillus myrtifloralis]
MERINSKQNQRIKTVKKLTTAKGRKQQHQYLLESWHLVQAALEALPATDIVMVYATDDQYLAHGAALTDQPVTLISEAVAQELGDTQTPQGIFLVCELPDVVNTIAPKGAWLLLDHVQDPGNIGTMVRTADAVGFRGVVFGTGTASPYHSKVLRAMQGSQFHLQVVEQALPTVIKQFQEHQVPIYGTELNPAAVNYRTITPQTDFALIMGNEGNGMDQALLQQTTKNLYIPIQGHAESLNVAIAAAVIMFRITAH